MENSSTREAGQPAPGHGSLTGNLRGVLRTELLKDACSADEIARSLSMHRRTLHRHLRVEGRTFRQVVNEVRFEIACNLLTETSMTLGEIALALKYSELSAFTRAFRRWSGQSPSAWRSSDHQVDGSNSQRDCAALVPIRN